MKIKRCHWCIYRLLEFVVTGRYLQAPHVCNVGVPCWPMPPTQAPVHRPLRRSLILCRLLLRRGVVAPGFRVPHERGRHGAHAAQRAPQPSTKETPTGAAPTVCVHQSGLRPEGSGGQRAGLGANTRDNTWCLSIPPDASRAPRAPARMYDAYYLYSFDRGWGRGGGGHQRVTQRRIRARPCYPAPPAPTPGCTCPQRTCIDWRRTRRARSEASAEGS